jgi:hypothetical protein
LQKREIDFVVIGQVFKSGAEKCHRYWFEFMVSERAGPVILIAVTTSHHTPTLT